MLWGSRAIIAIRGVGIAGQGGWKGSHSTKVVNVGLTEKVTFEHRLERGKGVSSADQGRTFQKEVTARAKAPGWEQAWLFKEEGGCPGGHAQWLSVDL